MTARPLGFDPVAVVVCRDGRLPAGAGEAVAEAGGRAVVAGTGASAAVASLDSATNVWVAESGTDPAGLAALLAPVLSPCSLIVLPASPDGRDLAPRLAAALARPLLAGVTGCRVLDGGTSADLLRADGRVTVPASVTGPAVATLWPGARPSRPLDQPPRVVALDLPVTSSNSARGDSGPSDPGRGDPGRGDPGRGGPARAGPGRVVSAGLVEPDPATMDLSEAAKVVGGGAGLVRRGAPDDEARAVFALLVEVAAALGASAGATRVVTDAGWMAPERQIGTTGVTLQPDLYVALGVSGATQHTGGLGDPSRVVSVNIDPSCPMTGMADLGVVADAPALLVELAGRLGIGVPEKLRREQ